MTRIRSIHVHAIVNFTSAVFENVLLVTSLNCKKPLLCVLPQDQLCLEEVLV